MRRKRFRMPSISEEKKALREKYIALRESIKPKQYASKCERIADTVISSEQFDRAKKILLYSPIRREADTVKIFRTALCSGKKVYFPRVDEKGGMDFFRVSSQSSLLPGKFGIREPSPESERLCDFSDALVITPLVAAARDKSRIGYGGGYYDRFFAAHGEVKRMGICFEMQVSDSLPAEATDIKLDYIVTECGII